MSHLFDTFATLILYVYVYVVIGIELRVDIVRWLAGVVNGNLNPTPLWPSLILFRPIRIESDRQASRYLLLRQGSL